MWMMGIEASSGPASCAVVRDGLVVAENYTNNGLTHSQNLMPIIDHTIRQAGIDFVQLDFLAVSVGPGSFTGVRIAVTSAKGLAFGDTLPCIPVSTLEAAAWRAAGGYEGLICVLMDARCGQIYTALFEKNRDELVRLSPDEALASEDMLHRLEKTGRAVLLAGDGAAMWLDMWRSVIPDIRIAPSQIRYPHAAGVCAAAARLQENAVPASLLQPVYLRMPQAQRERELRLRGGSG